MPIAAGLAAVPVSRAIGLDWVAVNTIAGFLGQAIGPDEHRYLKCLEAGALEQMNRDSSV